MIEMQRIPILSLAALLCVNAANASVRHSPRPRPQNKSIEAERNRAYARQQFQKNFKDLQTISQGLLKEHEAARLTPDRLAKDSKSINKCARNLRTMMALGEMAQEVEIDREIDTPKEFDQSIRRLHQLIYDFAHNPVHQNSKVFNTDQAERAQTDLLAIINLSKAMGDRSKSYTVTTTQTNGNN
jgi:hypothetical protein